jgi:hypothetical protein
MRKSSGRRQGETSIAKVWENRGRMKDREPTFGSSLRCLGAEMGTGGGQQ